MGFAHCPTKTMNLLAHTKEGVIIGIIPKDANLRHGLIEGTHCVHLLLYFFFGHNKITMFNILE